MPRIHLDQMNLVVDNVRANRAFFSALGLDFGEPHGHAWSDQPFDAFWGARDAAVSDPDGNGVGVMSPAHAAHRSEAPEEQ